MSTKIWLEELSLGSNFGNRAFGSNRIWCYFLVHTFKIKKPGAISSIWSRNTEKPIKIPFGTNFVSLRAFGSIFWQFRFPVYSFQTKNSIISTRSWVLVHITFAHGRTDRHFSKKYSFLLLIKNICIYMSIPISIIFQISPRFWQKLVYFFSILKIFMKSKN